MKRVLLAVTHAGVGGVARHVIDLCEYVNSKTTWRASIACGTSRTELLDEYKRVADQVYVLRSLSRAISPLDDIRALREIHRLLADSSFSVVHSHGPKAGFLFRLVSKNLGIPNIYTHHLVVYQQHKSVLNPVYRALERWASNWCDKVVTVTESARQTLARDRVTPLDKLTVIYNGVRNPETKYSREVARQVLGLDEKSFVIVTSSRLEPPKDPVNLLNAFSYYRERGNDGELYILGDGSLRPNLTRLVARLGISDHVHFRGFVNDVDLFLAAADVFVLSTMKEGFPIAILEAMKYSLPVVATGVDGISEQVVHGQSGYLVEVGDWRAMALFLEKLRLDVELRVGMGKTGRRILLENFTSVKTFQQIVALYEEVASA